MRTDKGLAIKLRLQGKSYGEIQKALGKVSKSTLSLWLSGVVLSKEARRKIALRTQAKSLAGLLRRNRKQTRDAEMRRDAIHKVSKKQVEVVTPRDLLYIGAALYWAEGHKRPVKRGGREVTHHPVSLTNSDPLLAKTFVLFLQAVCGVPSEKIRANIRIFEHMNKAEALSFWEEQIKIPRENFTSTYVGTSISSMNKRPYNRLPHGVIQIRVSDTNLFHKIMGWIEGLKENAAVAQW